MEGWLHYEFIGVWSLLRVPAAAGAAAGAQGDQQANAVPCNSNTGESHRSVGSVKTPANSLRSLVGLEEEEGRENPAVQGSYLQGGCWHRDLREQSFHLRNQKALVL